MAIQTFIEKYVGKLTTPIANVSRFESTVGGTITELNISCPNIGFGTLTFNFFINGVAKFSGAARPSVSSGSPTVAKTGLAFAVTKRDILSFDLQIAGGGGGPLVGATQFDVTISNPDDIPEVLDDLEDVEIISPADGDYLRYDGDLDIWYAAGIPTLPIGGACSDEDTPLDAATSVLTLRAPFACELIGVRSNVKTASSSGTVVVDINKNGVTMLSTKLSIDASEKTSKTAATPAVISVSTLADDDEITIDIDSAGTDASGLKVWLLIRPTP